MRQVFCRAHRDCDTFGGRGPVSQRTRCARPLRLDDLRDGRRWNALAAATQTINKLVGLADPLRAAKIGLALFPNASCDSRLAVRPDYSTKAAIASALAASMPSGSTPSGTAIRDAAALTELKDATRKQYIVLVTDGGPGCGGEPDTVTGTVNQITLARSAAPSIGTYVVGVGDGLSSAEQLALSQMATAGGYPEATMARYYKGTTVTELESSLTRIMIAIQTENAGCVDATPADMAMPADLGMPADMKPPIDLAAPPMDLASTGMDLAMTPADLAMTPMDLAMTPMDLAMTPMDLAMPPMDLAMPPMDLAMPPMTWRVFRKTWPPLEPAMEAAGGVPWWCRYVRASWSKARRDRRSSKAAALCRQPPAPPSTLKAVAALSLSPTSSSKMTRPSKCLSPATCRSVPTMWWSKIPMVRSVA